MTVSGPVVREQVMLAGYTTLGLGGPAARFVEADSEEQIIATVRSADAVGEPVLVLGGGSNLVVADEGFPGTVLHVVTGGVRTSSGPGGVTVVVAAGEDWDCLVQRCVGEGLSGIECLSGIPGLAGATPIQNVGAYGQDVSETIFSVRAHDRLLDTVVELTNADCGFGYRTSAFKLGSGAAGAAGGAAGAAGVAGGAAGGAGGAAGVAGGAAGGAAGAAGGAAGAAGGAAGAGRRDAPHPAAATGRFVVLGVTFRLAREPLSAPIGYSELARALDVTVGERVPLGEARTAVLALRRRKGMVLDSGDPDTRSAGSFFTNPVLGRSQFAEVERRAAAMSGRPGEPAGVPHFAAGNGLVKVSAAWLIEQAGFARGYPPNASVRISSKHTLALTNPGGASTADLVGLAREIRDGVRHAFGVELVSEPVLVGTEL